MNNDCCEFCQLDGRLCICDSVDRFFESCQNLKPYDGSKPKAPVYDLAAYRATGKLEKIA